MTLKKGVNHTEPNLFVALKHCKQKYSENTFLLSEMGAPETAGTSSNP